MPAPILVLTADPALREHVLRAAAAGGAELEVVAAVGAARRTWSTAPLVVVGEDLATASLQAGLPRRVGVVLACVGEAVGGSWEVAVAMGAERVIELPLAADWLADAVADAVEQGGANGRVVGVLGGRGGAGASVLAASLALRAHRAGLGSLLVDVDPLGGGIDLVLGGESIPGPRWPELTGSRGRLSASALDGAIPRMREVAVLSWDREGPPQDAPIEALVAVLGAARRTYDLVVLDLPRRPDVGDLAGLTDTTLLVVPAQVRAAAAAARLATAVQDRCADLRLVVRLPGPDGLDGPAVAAALGLGLAAELDHDRELDLHLERGQPRGRGPLVDTADRLLAGLGLLVEAAA